MKIKKIIFVDLSEFTKDNFGYFNHEEIKLFLNRLDWLDMGEGASASISIVVNCNTAITAAFKLTSDIQNMFGDRIKLGGVISIQPNFEHQTLLNIVTMSEKYLPTTDIVLMFIEDKWMAVEFAQRELHSAVKTPKTKRGSFMVLNYERRAFYSI